MHVFHHFEGSMKGISLFLILIVGVFGQGSVTLLFNNLGGSPGCQYQDPTAGTPVTIYSSLGPISDGSSYMSASYERSTGNVLLNCTGESTICNSGSNSKHQLFS